MKAVYYEFQIGDRVELRIRPGIVGQVVEVLVRYQREKFKKERQDIQYRIDWGEDGIRRRVESLWYDEEEIRLCRVLPDQVCLEFKSV